MPLAYVNPNSPLRLHYDVHEPVLQEGERCKGHVIMVMGFYLEGWLWFNQVQFLTRCGYRVATFDNRGVGQTDVPGGTYTTHQMAQDTLYLMLCYLRWEPEATHLVSISMGGMISLEMLAQLAEGMFDEPLQMPASSDPQIVGPPANIPKKVRRRFLSGVLMVTQATGWRIPRGIPPVSHLPSTFVNVLSALRSPYERGRFILEIAFSREWLQAESGKFHPTTGRPLTNFDTFIRMGSKQYFDKVNKGKRGENSVWGPIGQVRAVATHHVSGKRRGKIVSAGTPLFVVGATKDRMVRFSGHRELADSLNPYEYLCLDAQHFVAAEHSDEIHAGMLRLFDYARAQAASEQNSERDREIGPSQQAPKARREIKSNL